MAVAALPRSARPEPIRLGVVGVGNRGRANLMAVGGENVVAICDVDARYLRKAGERFPDAQRLHDWRELMKLADSGELDAVVVSTPDHTHAPIAAAAIRRGLHVYCEKPLAHDVHEVRFLALLAREHGVVTQMGTQIHSLSNYRRVVELVRSGAIGAVREVEVWCATAGWGGGSRPGGESPIPAHLDWELWLGPAPARPFHDGAYHPAQWRRFWDFGGGNLGDMGCHYLDLPFWALALDTPETVECDGPPPDPETAPRGVTVTWRFGPRDERPAVVLRWHDAGRRPAAVAKYGLEGWQSGVLFLGERGYVISDYERHAIGPEQRFRGFEPPEPTIPDSPGHHAEWLRAIRGDGRPSCSFDYSGPLTETVLLGNVSHRLGGKRLRWDAAGLRCPGAPEAEPLLRRRWRDGWAV
jgi:predicted dehydrogenase